MSVIALNSKKAPFYQIYDKSHQESVLLISEQSLMNADTVIIYIWLIFFFCYFHKDTDSLRGETIKMLIQFMMTMGTCIVAVLSKTCLRRAPKIIFPLRIYNFIGNHFFLFSKRRIYFSGKKLISDITLNQEHHLTLCCNSVLIFYQLNVFCWSQLKRELHERRMRLKRLIVTK